MWTPTKTCQVPPTPAYPAFQRLRNTRRRRTPMTMIFSLHFIDLTQTFSSGSVPQLLRQSEKDPFGSSSRMPLTLRSTDAIQAKYFSLLGMRVCGNRSVYI